MLNLLLLASTVAHATEVGTLKKLGIGANIGYPVSVTGKYFVAEKWAVSAYVGTSWGVYWDIRAQAERDLVTFHEWDFGTLGMYACAGLQLDIYPPSVTYGPTLNAAPGFYGGAAVTLRFSDSPAEVFAGADLGIGIGTWDFLYVKNDPRYGTLGPYGIGHANLGGRWFF